jgi:hypothetical protein
LAIDTTKLRKKWTLHKNQKEIAVENKMRPQSPDSVTITPLGGSDPYSVQPPFSVSGTGTPDGATVVGLLTATSDGSTIQSDNTAQISSQTWGAITFSDVPPGTYVLGVNEQDPNDGADAINVVVLPDAAVSIDNITPTSASSIDVTGTPSDLNLAVSGVIAASKPRHGKPHKQRGKPKYKITFDGLTSGTTYEVTVYPLRDNATGQTRRFKMP